MDRLREEMWSYRQELDFFQRAPEYRQLVDLRYQLRNSAIDLAEAREGDRELPRQAREMAGLSRDLYRLTNQLEGRTNLGNPAEVRQRADLLEEHAVEIRVLVGRLHEVLRLDFAASGPGAAPPVRVERR